MQAPSPHDHRPRPARLPPPKPAYPPPAAATSAHLAACALRHPHRGPDLQVPPDLRPRRPPARRRAPSPHSPAQACRARSIGQGHGARRLHRIGGGALATGRREMHRTTAPAHGPGSLAYRQEVRPASAGTSSSSTALLCQPSPRTCRSNEPALLLAVLTCGAARLPRTDTCSRARQLLACCIFALPGSGVMATSSSWPAAAVPGSPSKPPWTYTHLALARPIRAQAGRRPGEPPERAQGLWRAPAWEITRYPVWPSAY